MNKTWWIVGLCGLCVLSLSPKLHPNDYREGRSRDPRARVQANRSSLARILGEFRTGMSDMLFIKTERYLHSGVGYVPHLTETLLTVEGTADEVTEHQEEVEEDAHGHAHHPDDHDSFHHDEKVETLLPTPQQDYRGWIGRMHRKVKPSRDPELPHMHTDGSELIPWFRMMTLSDPGYIRGYIVGTFWIQNHDRDAALEFLEEGLRHNPDAFQLHLSKGILLMKKARRVARPGVDEHENPDQMSFLLQARDSFLTAADRMEEQRPDLPENMDITELPQWGFYLESDAMSCAYLSVLFEQRYGDPAAASVRRQRYLKLFPDHSKLRDL